jgi:alkylated DNA repair dioxygenase AlkB
VVLGLRETAHELARGCLGDAGPPFHAVLINRYRDGSDSVDWHADDEPELGPRPLIVSVSLGASRRFQFRRRDDPTTRVDTWLHHGDVVVMSGDTQHRWLHRVPKERGVVAERLCLTFRHVEAAAAVQHDAPEARR